MSSHPKVWLVTGSSTGFGKKLVEALLKTNAKVVATARNPEALTKEFQHSMDKLLILKLDITKKVERKTAVAEAIKYFGRIDVLVNNAGYGLLGAVEEPTEEEVREQFETNVFGLIFLTQEVLPYMRIQKYGHILNMSSVAGFDASAGFGIYNASKFAVEGLSEALHHESAHLGIKVNIIEPGPFRTDFGSRSLKIAQEIADYAPTAGEKRKVFKDFHDNMPGDPDRAAWAMIDLVDNPIPALRVPMGRIAWDRISKKLERVGADLKITREMALSLDFEN
jgi:NAD(P)-dependent dehydrogenase (short-subunit alcohol dehydrogenase family)